VARLAELFDCSLEGDVSSDNHGIGSHGLEFRMQLVRQFYSVRTVIQCYVGFQWC
jgi:hypothetical protein